jgi:hypothetical protein
MKVNADPFADGIAVYLPKMEYSVDEVEPGEEAASRERFFVKVVQFFSAEVI